MLQSRIELDGCEQTTSIFTDVFLCNFYYASIRVSEFMIVCLCEGHAAHKIFPFTLRNNRDASSHVFLFMCACHSAFIPPYPTSSAANAHPQIWLWLRPKFQRFLETMWCSWLMAHTYCFESSVHHPDLLSCEFCLTAKVFQGDCYWFRYARRFQFIHNFLDGTLGRGGHFGVWYLCSFK